VLLDGEDIAGTEPVRLCGYICYVFKGIELFPYITSEEKMPRVPPVALAARGAARRAAELLERVRLEPEGYRGRFLAELSASLRTITGASTKASG